MRGMVAIRGGMGGGETSRGGNSGASGACFTLGEVSPTEGSLFLTRGGSGGGGAWGAWDDVGGGGGAWGGRKVLENPDIIPL